MRHFAIVLTSLTLLAALTPAASGLVVEKRITPDSTREAGSAFTVAAEKRADGLIHFRIDYRLPGPRYLVASTEIRDGDTLVMTSSTPAYVREDSATFHVAVSPRHAAGSKFQLSENGFAQSGKDPVPLPGGIHYELRLSDFAALAAAPYTPPASVPAAAGAAAAAAAAEKPAAIAIADLKPEHDGKQVTLSFKVQKTYMLSGSVPIGRTPSFQIVPELGDAPIRFSVLVSGDLADLMQRFGLHPWPGDPVKGYVIEATGKISYFPQRGDAKDKGPSYQLLISDWKQFRIVGRPDPRKADQP